MNVRTVKICIICNEVVEPKNTNLIVDTFDSYYCNVELCLCPFCSHDVEIWNWEACGDGKCKDM